MSSRSNKDQPAPPPPPPQLEEWKCVGTSYDRDLNQISIYQDFRGNTSYGAPPDSYGTLSPGFEEFRR